ncbi:MAG: NTP transferase domain-containing protein, partial [Sphingomonadales bacterium]|nr:NTP transferase domain-containing protein [Sphingomonadales bacterium]
MLSTTALLIRPVILSGGSGTRLWPLSTAERPKQFLPLVGEHSLLHETFARLTDAMFAPATVICGAAHVDQVRETASGAGFEAVRVVAEPAPRNTAAAIALAALTAENADELLLILPSDHHIEQPERFRETVADAVEAAEAGLIVTFGMKPTRAETGFGYVE